LLVFVVTAYIASDFRIQRRLMSVLAGAVVVLAGLRCLEGFVFGKVGEEVVTALTTQNSYGILFSTFTPFLFPSLLGRGLRHKAFCAVGLLVILYACAINGSRGSWVAIAVGLAVFCALAFVSRPGASLRLVLPLGLATLALLALLAGSGRARESVLSRFSTFESLELDKSYMSRHALNQKSWRLFSQSPLFGIGPGRFMDVYVPLDLPEIFARAVEENINRKGSHNSYLSYLAEGGVIGTLPLALLLALLALRGAPAAVALNSRGEHWALAVYCSFIAMSVHFWALSGLTGTHAWFVYGLLAGMISLAARARRQEAAALARARLPCPGPPFGIGVASPSPAVSGRYLTVDS
jgi:O-antigen ligase